LVIARSQTKDLADLKEVKEVKDPKEVNDFLPTSNKILVKNHSSLKAEKKKEENVKNHVLAVNGEIYNHVQVRKELNNKETVFQTNSDCEIILHLYNESIESEKPKSFTQILNKLNGIFAFVLLDEVNDTFLIARDHIGICPLYWGYDSDGALWVCSELKGIHDMCTWFAEFPPGCYYSSTDNDVVRWYNPIWMNESKQNLLPLTEDFKFQQVRSTDESVKKVFSQTYLNSLVPKLKEQLENAVKRQLMCDVPYGVLLSGGLDSSIIAAIVARFCQKRIESEGKTEAWYPRLHSFSTGLVGSPDLLNAAIVAKHLGTVHHEFSFTLQEALDAVADVIYYLETYDVTTIRAGTPMYLLSRRIKPTGVKMVLSGEGSDEIFGGYLYFHKCPSDEELQKELVRKLQSLSKFDCLRANKATAAFGIEARVPFLDKEFLDFAMNEIPASEKRCGQIVKIGNSQIENGPIKSTEEKKVVIEKAILRKAFAGYLPDEIINRQKEQFSDGVGYGWIDTLKKWCDERVTKEMMDGAATQFPINTPTTTEAYWIRATFESYFPSKSAAKTVPGGPSIACSSSVALQWDESFKKMADCSGRSVSGVHRHSYSKPE
jgi:asparagine synthase (glutamine-hydrolysing)